MMIILKSSAGNITITMVAYQNEFCLVFVNVSLLVGKSGQDGFHIVPVRNVPTVEDKVGA